MPNTRIVHVVRIRPLALLTAGAIFDPTSPNPEPLGKDNANDFIDVEVLDAVVFDDQYGVEHCLIFSQDNPGLNPYIKDTAQVYNGPHGDPELCSRFSDLGSGGTMNFEEIKSFVVTDTADDTDYAWLANNKTTAVVDNTGHNLSQSLSVDSTRMTHIVAFYDVSNDVADIKGSGTPNPLFNTGNPNGSSKYLLVKQTDCICFFGAGGEDRTMVDHNAGTQGQADPNDMVGSKDQDQMGTIIALDMSENLWDKLDITHYGFDQDGNKVPPDNTDFNPYIVWPKNTIHPWQTTPVDQGPLWRIVDVGVQHPWFYYLSVQQPMELSFLGTGPFPAAAFPYWAIRPWVGMGRWGFRYKDPIVKLDPVGYKSLDDCLDNNAIESYARINFLGAPSKNITGDTIWHRPNIYQAVGEKQPQDKYGNYIFPSIQEQKKIMEKLLQMWNGSSDAYNRYWAAVGGPTGFPPPRANVFWKFACTLYNPSLPTNRFAFVAGIPAAWLFFDSFLDPFQPVYAKYIAIQQLDPTIWNTDTDPPTRWSGPNPNPPPGD